MSKYSVISEKRRRQLIDLVKKQGKTIVSAAKKLKIKISTAKSILYSYEKSGKVLRKKKHQKVEKPKDQAINQSEKSFENEQIKTKDIIKQQQKEQPPALENMLNQNFCSNPYLLTDPQVFPFQWNYFQIYPLLNQISMTQNFM